MRVALTTGLIAACLAVASPALADVALDPEDEIAIAQSIIAEHDIACGTVVDTRDPEPRERDRLEAMGYRWRWVAVCSNGTRVVIGRNLRRGLRNRPPSQYLRVVPRGRR